MRKVVAVRLTPEPSLKQNILYRKTWNNLQNRVFRLLEALQPHSIFASNSLYVGVIRVYGTAEFEENLSRNTEF